MIKRLRVIFNRCRKRQTLKVWLINPEIIHVESVFNFVEDIPVRVVLTTAVNNSGFTPYDTGIYVDKNKKTAE